MLNTNGDKNISGETKILHISLLLDVLLKTGILNKTILQSVQFNSGIRV
jgi:hypothetical protein